jgi:hypothetical protein
MTTKYRFANFRITLRERDHNPPHVHLMGPDFEAVICLGTLDVLDGAAPAKVLRHALRWLDENKEELIRQWHTLHG